MEERLQKILSSAGIASRRSAEELIRAGRVTVDGVRVTTLGSKYDAALHEIAVDGRRVQMNEARVYMLLNKPRGSIRWGASTPIRRGCSSSRTTAP